MIEQSVANASRSSKKDVEVSVAYVFLHGVTLLAAGVAIAGVGYFAWHLFRWIGISNPYLG